MVTARVFVPMRNPSCLLPLWEDLQGQLVGLAELFSNYCICTGTQSNVKFCTHYLRAESLFPTAFKLSHMQAPLAFKARSFGGLSSQCKTPKVREPNMGLRLLTPWGEPLQLPLSSHLWVAYLGVWVLIILCLFPSYHSHCDSFFICLVVENIFC